MTDDDDDCTLTSNEQIWVAWLTGSLPIKGPFGQAYAARSPIYTHRFLSLSLILQSY